MAKREVGVVQGINFFEAKEVSKAFGGLRAVSEFSLSVKPKQIKGLIGPNGAGKSTFLNLILNLLSVDSGHILFKGIDITGLPVHEVSRLGLTCTFQIVRLFSGLDVLTNVMVGLEKSQNAGFLGCGLRSKKYRQEEKYANEEAMACLEIVNLAGKAFHKVDTLPMGQRKLLQIARAIASKPELLLLDEPFSGLNDVEREELGAQLLELRDRGIALLLVEHNVDITMRLCDEIGVMNFGRKIAEGSPSEIRQNPEVISSYLGTEA